MWTIISTNSFVNVRMWQMQAIAEEAQSESKWKQLGELAMSSGKVSPHLIMVLMNQTL